jgi:spore coat protein U-like protein
MPLENEQGRLLSEQAAILASAVSDMSEQMGKVSNGLSSLTVYGHRNRTMILVTIISLVIDLSLTVALTIVTFNVISSNQKINVSFGSINCLTNAVTATLHESSAYDDVSIRVLNLKEQALVLDVSSQANNGSAAEHVASRTRYLDDIAAINKIAIPPRPVFSAHC